jgi:hypothetical protein
VGTYFLAAQAPHFFAAQAPHFLAAHAPHFLAAQAPHFFWEYALQAPHFLPAQGPEAQAPNETAATAVTTAVDKVVRSWLDKFMFIFQL